MDSETHDLLEAVPKKPYTHFLWVPFVWYAILSTRSVSYWFSADTPAIEFDYLEGSPVDRNIYLLIIVAGTLILIFRRIPWSKTVQANGWLCALLLYMLISILWSDFPEVAIKRWVKVFGSIVMAMIVLSEPEPLEAISALLRRVLLVHIPLDIVMVKYFRTIGVGWDEHGMEMWNGLTTHKNILGQVCMIGGLYFIWDIFTNATRRRVMIDLLYLAMIVYLFRGSGHSYSVSSLLVLFAGLLVFFLLLSPKEPEFMKIFLVKRAVILFLLVVFIVGGLAAIYPDRPFTGAVLAASGRESTLTGRTDLWEDIVEHASRNPITGVGYGSFWIGNKAHRLWEKHFWKPNQGHNGFIDIYVELGLVGLFLFGGVLVSTYKKLKQMVIENIEFGRFHIALFMMIVAHNLSESSFLRGDNDIWFIFLLVAMSTPSREGKADALPAGDGESSPWEPDTGSPPIWMVHNTEDDEPERKGER